MLLGGSLQPYDWDPLLKSIWKSRNCSQNPTTHLGLPPQIKIMSLRLSIIYNQLYYNLGQKWGFDREKSCMRNDLLEDFNRLISTYFILFLK